MRGGYKNLAILRFNLIDSPFGIIGVEIKAIAVDKKPVIPASRLGPVFSVAAELGSARGPLVLSFRVWQLASSSLARGDS